MFDEWRVRLEVFKEIGNGAIIVVEKLNNNGKLNMKQCDEREYYVFGWILMFLCEF